MKIQMVVAICTLLIVEILIFAMEGSSGRSVYGLAHLTFSIYCFFIGLILVLIKKTRHIGEGMLLGTGLLLLTGLFLCSN